MHTYLIRSPPARRSLIGGSRPPPPRPRGGGVSPPQPAASPNGRSRGAPEQPGAEWVWGRQPFKDQALVQVSWSRPPHRRRASCERRHSMNLKRSVVHVGRFMIHQVQGINIASSLDRRRLRTIDWVKHESADLYHGLPEIRIHAAVPQPKSTMDAVRLCNNHVFACFDIFVVARSGLTQASSHKHASAASCDRLQYTTTNMSSCTAPHFTMPRRTAPHRTKTLC